MVMFLTAPTRAAVTLRRDERSNGAGGSLSPDSLILDPTKGSYL
jgi:hypothetical protein